MVKRESYKNFGAYFCGAANKNRDKIRGCKKKYPKPVIIHHSSSADNPSTFTALNDSGSKK